jgi:thioredoxin reductase
VTGRPTTPSSSAARRRCFRLALENASRFLGYGLYYATTATGAVAWLPQSFETNRPGIFAVGDVRRGSVKRVAAAVGEGSACVQQVHQALRH